MIRGVTACPSLDFAGREEEQLTSTLLMFPLAAGFSALVWFIIPC
jgi:hypothetical protein